MNLRTLIRRSLRFHWRAHLGVVLGAAIGSAALIGALVVGDSVKGSLRERALIGLAGVHFALDANDRLFETALFDRMVTAGTNDTARINRSPGSAPQVAWGSLGQWNGSAVLQLAASATRQDGTARANAVQCYGIDARYFKFILNDFAPVPGGVYLNAALARQLLAHKGDRLIFRVRKPSSFSQEASISQRSETSVALPLVVAGILPAWPGDFRLRGGAAPPLNAFLPIAELQRAVAREGRANLLLASWGTTTRRPDFGDQTRHFFQNLSREGRRQGSLISIGNMADDHETLAKVQTYLHDLWSLKDAEVDLVLETNSSAAEIKSQRIFLDPPVIRAARSTDPNTRPILTYLATLLAAGSNATPYSMVTAAGAPWTPADLRDDEIVVGQWLADDLQVKPGDEIALSYFLPESGARLEEATNKFRVRSIVPMELPWADRTLMPDFPGIEKAESTSEWDAGFPLTYKVRPKDDDYWKQHRGKPKAFITLAAGQKMWGNRFGNLTAIRFPIPTNTLATNFQTALEQEILANLKPEELGLRFEPVREQALKAAEESQDFGGLFLGFSFFLIVAALLLMAMLFQFGLEQRAPEIGTLLALGFPPAQVRKLLLREGVVLAFLGGVLGTIGGVLYAGAMLHGLATVWRDAIGGTSLNFHVTAQTLVIGLSASVIVSAATIWLALRKIGQREPRELLNASSDTFEQKVAGNWAKYLAVLAGVAALGLVGYALAKGDTANAEMFFGAGALVLIAGLNGVSAWLRRLGGATRKSDSAVARGESFTSRVLATRGCARRRKRSVGTIAMLACGSFLIVSIGVFRLDANLDASSRTSGTGGFALLGETTMPVVQDLNASAGRDFFALSETDLPGVNFVPFRVRAGDEASCLNLHSAQRPRLLGVKPESLAGRFSFAKLADGGPASNPWAALAPGAWYPKYEQPLTTDEVAAIGDANSIQWALHKKVGDTIDYVDERGQPFKVRIVGAVANSILQGQLLIDEVEFVKRFPGESGYRMFLIDAPSNHVAEVSAKLARALQDVGLELTATATRLNQFNAVQNTYLGTFQVLGGLGLLLGSFGLGVVVLRNVLERRGELALLLAVGFRKPQVQRLLLLENGVLLTLGLGIGLLAAGVAVLPAVLAPNAQLPVRSLGVTLLAVFVNGALWTWIATAFALRGDLLAALRNE